MVLNERLVKEQHSSVRNKILENERKQFTNIFRFKLLL